MGLHTEPEIWRGSCISFRKFREQIAMGFEIDYEAMFWERREFFNKDSGIFALLNHSDSDRMIPWQECKEIVDELISKRSLILGEATSPFEHEILRGHLDEMIVGCFKAFESQTDVEFC